MNITDLFSWIAVSISILTSIVRALNIGFQKYTYILSSLASIMLIYNAYQLNSNQLIFLNTFHGLISLMGVYRWHHKKE